MIYFDFEYNDRQVILCCAENSKTKESFIFDLRGDTDEFKEWFHKNKDSEIFCSYALSAEIDSLCRLGIDTKGMKCIDLMAECRQISMSHYDYFVPGGTLLDHLSKFLKMDVTESREVKDQMRDLILTQDNWSKDEWEQIVYYCLTDIANLQELFRKVASIHKELNHKLSKVACLNRGEYIRASAEMDFKSSGFPVDVEAVDKIYGNKDHIKKSIIQNLPFIWRDCYGPRKGGGFTLSRHKILNLIKKRGWTLWKMTDNGLPCLDSEYLKELSIIIPEVESLRQAQKSLVTLNSADMRDQLKDGYIKPNTNSFAAKTGRNGLKPRRGYLLNFPKWMRKMIHPEPGMALISVDWSQQEIAIAAALSGDKKMIEAYRTGDVYLALGKMSGHIPENGTKQTHKTERDLFKALQLALGYGKGVKSLGRDFMGIMKEQNITEIESQLLAKEIYNWHKGYFMDYWNWIEGQVKQAKLQGWISTVDDWICCVNYKTPKTALLNFPSQGNGASAMRLATVKFYEAYRNGEIPVLLCSQHDGFYFNVEEEDVEICLPIIEKIMDETGQELFKIGIRCDHKVFTNQNSYEPEGMTNAQIQLWEIATI